MLIKLVFYLVILDSNAFTHPIFLFTVPILLNFQAKKEEKVNTFFVLHEQREEEGF